MENGYIKYAEYLSENPDLVDYNKYTEIASPLRGIIDNKLIERRNKIEKIMIRKF